MLLVVLTIVVVLGITTGSGRTLPGLPRFALTAVHRSSSLLALVLLAIHLLTLLLDPYAQVALVDSVVPFAAGYRPFWVGLGTVALDLLVALVVTSLLRRRIGLRAWRAVHLSAYALWPVALAHGLGSGTDARRWWFLATAAGCAAATVAAVIWRLQPGYDVRRRPRPPTPHPHPPPPVIRAVPTGKTGGRTARIS